MNTTPDTFWSLFAGYGAFFLILAGFLFSLMRKQARLAGKLDELEAGMNAQEPRRPARSA